jgi:DNA-binding NtrC family response regulator
MATILLADDDEDIRLALSLLLSGEGYQILEADSAKSTIIQANQQQPDLILLDMNFSRDTTSGKEGLEILAQLKPMSIPVILMTAWSSVELAVDGLKLGATDFIEKPWNKHKLLNSVSGQLKLATLKEEHQGYRQLLAGDDIKDWVCHAPAMQSIEQLINQIAPTDANILILGENGTGKSLLAQRIHQLSSRHQGPLIIVNMAAIPENLFESELFGHQKGAFTDAKQHRTGRFQLANQGTLFLDEIGTLPLNLQPKLLRVLETGQYEILGSSQTQVANVRLISATNANLSQMVGQGQFRQDLLYRLNTMVITIPPLRLRIDDIKPLVAQFIRQFCRKYKKTALTLNPQALSILQNYPWPGNIRELSHVIERAVLLSTGDEITPQQLILDAVQANETNKSLPLQTLEETEKQLINQAMDKTDGQVIEAAKLLGISRNALYRRMEKHGIEHDA